VPQEEIVYNGAVREQMGETNNVRCTEKYFPRGHFIINPVEGKLKDQRKDGQTNFES
jgi:hypothetical protein